MRGVNELIVKKDTLIYQDKLFDLNDLFTEELYRISNENVQYYESNVCIVNEIFLNRVQPTIALTHFIEKNQIEYINIKEKESSLYPILVDVANKCDVKISGTSSFFGLYKIVFGNLTLLASMVFILWKMLKIPHSEKIIAKENKFSVIRTLAAQKKLFFLQDVNIRVEKLTDKKNVYNCFGRAKRVIWVLKAWIKSYRELGRYKNIIKGNIGTNSALDAFAYYSKRVIHTLLYSYMIDEYFEAYKGKTFYTGNNLDRFAIIEERAAKKYNIKTICIPHGLEYGFKLPHVFTCDEFYTTSEITAEHLNDLYGTEKFIYKEEIAQQMFTVSCGKKKERSIVFFTEPREVFVNIKIIDEILPLMEKNHMRLSIKLHPKDKKIDYEKYKGRVNFIENFNDSISRNICFSRKSTTLLEAIYNGSVSAAILTNAKDIAVFSTFTSLQDRRIKVFYSISGLFDWIKRESIV